MLFKHLREGTPKRIVHALLEATKDEEYIRGIPLTSWTSIIEALNPKKWSQPYHHTHRSMSKAMIRSVGLDIAKVNRDLLSILFEVTSIASTAGVDLDLPEYRRLLTYAANVGNPMAAKRIFFGTMAQKGVAPDIVCYNALMESIVFDENLRLEQGKHAEKTLPRQQDTIPGLRIREFAEGCSLDIMEIHRDMKEKSGIHPDTNSYCVLMTALARDGNLQRATKILDNVWGIRFYTDANGNDQEVRSDLKLEPDSPIYPNKRLLVTVADVYGSHNEISAGLRLVDFISRNYNIQVKKNVWYQLLRWLWLHSNLERRHGKRLGQNVTAVLDRAAALFDMIRSQEGPDAVAPDVYMLHAAFKNALGRWLTGKEGWTDIVDAGAGLLKGPEKIVRDGAKKGRGLDVIANKTTGGVLDKPGAVIGQRSPGHVKSLYRRQLISRQIRTSYLRRWVNITIQEGVPESVPANHHEEAHVLDEWYYRGLPSFILRQIYLVPNTVRYQTRTGAVLLQVRTPEETEQRKIDGSQRLKWLRQRLKVIKSSPWNRTLNKMTWCGKKANRTLELRMKQRMRRNVRARRSIKREMAKMKRVKLLLVQPSKRIRKMREKIENAARLRKTNKASQGTRPSPISWTDLASMKKADAKLEMARRRAGRVQKKVERAPRTDKTKHARSSNRRATAREWQHIQKVKNKVGRLKKRVKTLEKERERLANIERNISRKAYEKKSRSRRIRMQERMEQKLLSLSQA